MSALAENIDAKLKRLDAEWQAKGDLSIDMNLGTLANDGLVFDIIGFPDELCDWIAHIHKAWPDVLAEIERLRVANEAHEAYAVSVQTTIAESLQQADFERDRSKIYLDNSVKLGERIIKLEAENRRILDDCYERLGKQLQSLAELEAAAKSADESLAAIKIRDARIGDARRILASFELPHVSRPNMGTLEGESTMNTQEQTPKGASTGSGDRPGDDER